MEPGQVVAIALSVIVAVALLSGLAVWLYRRKGREKLLPLDQHLKQNVLPSCEGAGEADTRSFDLRKRQPTCVILPRQMDKIKETHTLAAPPRTLEVLQSKASAMTSTFQKPAHKTVLGRLLKERMSQILENPTGPPPDTTLDYGYEGGISDAEEDLHETEQDDEEEEEDEEEKGLPSYFSRLASDSQSWENIGDKYIAPDLCYTVADTFQNPAGTTCLGRLLPERMNRVLEEPNGPPPDNTLDYGYEGGISDGEENPHEEGEKEDDESSPSNLASLASGSQLYENVGENNCSQNSQGHGHVLDDLLTQDMNLHIVMPTSFPRPPPPPQQQQQQEDTKF